MLNTQNSSVTLILSFIEVLLLTMVEDHVQIWTSLELDRNYLQVQAVAHVGVHGDDSESRFEKECVVTIFTHCFKSRFGKPIKKQ